MEKYPPAMNFVYDVLSQKTHYQISVITSLNSSPFANQEYEGVKIYRLGLVSENSVKRYLSYLIFNSISILTLFFKRPDVVVVYETLSVLPAFIYSKVFKKKKIHIHYHEYMSKQEKKDASLYMTILLHCEQNLLKNVTCSQTNEQRKALFLECNPFLKNERVTVFPNFPPKSWWLDYGQHKIPWKGGKIKLVYVGALDVESMYLEEVLNWVSKNSERLELTFYCQQISEGAKILLASHSNKNITIASPIPYYELPNYLIEYDFGLSLYNGAIQNHIYSVPNKVYEYLSCGLYVISAPEILSLKLLEIPSVIIIDYLEISEQTVDFLKSKLSFPINGISQQNTTLLEIL